MISANDPKHTSWVSVPKDSDFPIQNLPFGIFTPRGAGTPRLGVAIGEEVLDLAVLADAGFFKGVANVSADVFRQPALNPFLSCGRDAWRAVRERVSVLLRAETAELRDNAAVRAQALVRQDACALHLPVVIGDYVDFYSSLEHATNVGSMFRDPSNPLLPNWKHIPIGYHGRSSSVVVSGTDFHRPCGQLKPDEASPPQFAPSKQVDFELEMGFLVGTNTALGESVPTRKAQDCIFGLVLVNDWSARDIQKWEYVPLGPFLGKSFATSISPWVVTLDALEPFRVAGPRQDPPVLPYLACEGPQNYDINLEVFLQADRAEAQSICRTNFRHMYWSMTQQLAHMTSNGTNIRVGDLYASGTISGPTPDSYGSMLELCWKGTKPLSLADGTQRSFVADLDSIVMRGHAQNKDVRIGFGEVRARVLPARAAD